jgi:hypothetical protein
LAIAHVTYMATARPWRRGHPRRGGVKRRRRARTKGPALSPDWHARERGCTLAQGRWTRAASRANPNVSGNTTQRRVQRRYGAVHYGDKEDYANERACVDVGSGTCKKSSSQPGTKAGITSGGAVARRRGASGVPPRLDGRGIHKREAAVVLTSVAPSRSAVCRCSEAVRLAGEGEEEEGGGASSGK